MKKILIVDDNDTNQLLLKMMFKLVPEKVSIQSAFNGQEAIEQLLEDSDFTAIIMDIQMPILDGLTTTQLIKLRWPDLPIYLHSCCGDKKLFENPNLYGFTDILEKPLDKHHFIDFIKKSNLAQLN